jgi:hypothetical protein
LAFCLQIIEIPIESPIAKVGEEIASPPGGVQRGEAPLRFLLSPQDRRFASGEMGVWGLMPVEGAMNRAPTLCGWACRV